MRNEKILVLREKILKIYKHYEKWIIAIVKYIGAVSILAMITNKIGYFEPLGRNYVILALGAMCIMMPSQRIVMLMMGIITVHLATFNIIIGTISFIAMLVVYFTYVRFYPKESILIIITMIAMLIKCEYVVIMLIALFWRYSSIGAISIGVIGTYSYATIALLQTGKILTDSIVNDAEKIRELIMQTMLLNADMLGTLVVFIVVFSSIYFIRYQAIDYAPYIAIAVGATMNLLGFGMAMLFIDVKVNLTVLICMTVISALVSAFVQFFAIPMNYARTENVQFEDEHNYYYVKVVPKLSVRIESESVEQVYNQNIVEEEMF
ncbi:MAG: hypothetical protein ACRCSG_07105 [Cellulosilyticaceae bacterium]